MAIKAGLVGVNPKGVDHNGMPIASDGNSVKETQLTANGKKFFFAYDETSEKYGYKLDGTGDFIPFESAGGGPGWVKPADLVTTGLSFGTSFEHVDGGYYEDENTVYVDITLLVKSRSNLGAFPTCIATTGRFLVVVGDDETVKDNYISNTDACYMFASSGNLNLQNLPSNNKYYHVYGIYTKA